MQAAGRGNNALAKHGRRKLRMNYLGMLLTALTVFIAGTVPAFADLAWVLGIELWCSVRKASTLNRGAISPDSRPCLLTNKIVLPAGNLRPRCQQCCFHLISDRGLQMTTFCCDLTWLSLCARHLCCLWVWPHLFLRGNQSK